MSGIVVKPYSDRPRRQEPCPKCGIYASVIGSDWRSTYRADPEIAPDGELLWACPSCGYVIVTETADAE